MEAVFVSAGEVARWWCIGIAGGLRTIRVARVAVAVYVAVLTTRPYSWSWSWSCSVHLGFLQ